jgi:hypothetical protein
MSVLPLPGIWTPRRDARGLFVPRGAPYAALIGNIRNWDKAPSFFYPIPDGIYRSNANTIDRLGEYGGIARGVPTPYGLGIDAPRGYEQLTGKRAAYFETGSASVVLVSVFSLYNAGTYINPASFEPTPAVLGESRAVGLAYQFNEIAAWYKNDSGEQALRINTIPDGNGTDNIFVNGLSNGLHCLVLCYKVNGGANGARAFLNGKLVGTGPTVSYTNFWGIRSYYFWGSLSQSDLNIGNVHFNANIANLDLTNEQAAQFSLDPYRFFFVDAPTQKSRLSRLISLGQSFQFSRPSADLLTGWTRVPASGTHVSAINEITSNQTDYLSASAGNLIDSFTMGELLQPASGGVDINLDIDASARPVTVDLLDGATVVKSASVSTTGQTTITATAAELSGVSWPWTPTIRITSQ